jgi:hypothetical protein
MCSMKGTGFAPASSHIIDVRIIEQRALCDPSGGSTDLSRYLGVNIERRYVCTHSSSMVGSHFDR